MELSEGVGTLWFVPVSWNTEYCWAVAIVGSLCWNTVATVGTLCWAEQLNAIGIIVPTDLMTS